MRNSRKMKDAAYSEKANELKFDEKIDDQYTNEIVDMYEQGFKKNRWFLTSGALSFFFGFICIFAIIITDIVLAAKSSRGEYDMDANKTKLIIATIVLMVYGILSTLIGMKIRRYANYTREMLMEKSALVMFDGCIQFLFGGVFPSIFTFVGYFVGRGIDYGAIYYNRIDGYNKKEVSDKGDDAALEKRFKYLSGEFFDSEEESEEEIEKTEEKEEEKFDKKKHHKNKK